jgi:L-cysteine S-thiosulfotransferase
MRPPSSLALATPQGGRPPAARRSRFRGGKLGRVGSAWVAMVLSVLAMGAWAQTKSTADGIAEYRALLADGNPADLFEAKGEALWKQKRGPKNASLEACDLGKGPGVVKGAFVELPRWFADTQKVQDLESRLLSCMQTLQGLDAVAIANTPFGKGEQINLEGLVAYVSAESRGLRMNLPQQHPQERVMYEVGKRVFYFRGGSHDFSCASCHGEDGKRIRLQELPQLSKNPGDGIGFAAWPAYRVSSGELWSMQRRLNDCFRQQRFPYPGYGSDVTVALGVYMGVNAKGAQSAAPAIKR